MNLTKEHVFLVTESPGALEGPHKSPENPRTLPPCLLTPPLMAGSSEHPGASPSDKLLEPKITMSLLGGRQDYDSAMSTVTGILRAAKVKSAKGSEVGSRSLSTTNSEISKLLAQFPLKSTETSKTPDNKMVRKETKVIKDFLQNSMFNGPGPKEPAGLGPFLLLPPPPSSPEKPAETSAQKRQLPVFAKICSKPEADPPMEGHNLMGE